jgi:hypothetical protein
MRRSPESQNVEGSKARSHEMIWVIQPEGHVAADRRNRDFTSQRFQHGARRKVPKRDIVKRPGDKRRVTT